MGEEATTDHLATAELSRAGLRVVAAVTTNLCAEACRRHYCTPASAEVLAEAMTATVLLSAALDGIERVTLHWSGNGPVGGAVVDAGVDGTVRGYVKNARARLPWRGPRLAALGGRGMLAAVREREGHRTEGSVERRGKTISEDVAVYLDEAMRRPAAVLVDVRLGVGGEVAAAAGVLVQAVARSGAAAEAALAAAGGASSDPGGLPDGDALAVHAARAALESHGRNRLLVTPDGGPLRAAGIAARALAALGSHLVSAEDLPLTWACRCSRANVERILGALGVQEIAKMLEKEGKGEIKCEFCGRRFEFNRAEMHTILRTLVSGKAN